MSVQTADEVIDTFMLKLLVEGLMDITAVIALFAALFITWRVLRSHRLANLDGLNRIGKGMGFLFLSMLLTGLLEVVDVALVLSFTEIDEFWKIMAGSIPLIVGAFFIASGARQFSRSHRVPDGPEPEQAA